MIRACTPEYVGKKHRIDSMFEIPSRGGGRRGSSELHSKSSRPDFPYQTLRLLDAFGFVFTRCCSLAHSFALLLESKMLFFPAPAPARAPPPPPFLSVLSLPAPTPSTPGNLGDIFDGFLARKGFVVFFVRGCDSSSEGGSTGI